MPLHQVVEEGGAHADGSFDWIPPKWALTGVKVPVMNMRKRRREEQGRTGAGAQVEAVSRLGSRWLSPQGLLEDGSRTIR